jgi:DNA replication protein DnaC
MSSNAKSAQPRVELDRTREALVHLGLEHGAELLADHVARAVKDDLPLHRFLDELLTAEIEHRDERRVRTSLKLSGLPPGHTLEEFDWGFQPSIDRRRVEQLATCEFVRRHEVVLFQGPPGVGKTHLAIALGVKAVAQGFSVSFYRLDDLLHALRRDADVPPRKLKGKKYMSSSLLIMDEVGFQPLSRADAALLFRLVSCRYRRGSTIITTNKSVQDWPEILAGDEVMATALLDRLLHHCHVFNLQGRSFRLRALEAQLP